MSVPRRDVGEEATKTRRGGDARSHGTGFGPGGFGEEVGDDAVSGVAADDASGVDDALIGGADEATRELEELRAGQATRQGRRAVEVGGQNRHLVTVGRLQHPHPFEVRQICDSGGDRELRHPDRRFAELADAREATITVVDSNHDHSGSNLDTGVRHHAPPGQCDGKFLRLQLVDQVRVLGMNDSTKLVATSRCARQNIGTERPESRSPELQWSSKVRYAKVRSSSSASPKLRRVSSAVVSSCSSTMWGSGAAVKTTGMPRWRLTRSAASVPTSAIRRWMTSGRGPAIGTRRMPRSTAMRCAQPERRSTSASPPSGTAAERCARRARRRGRRSRRRCGGG